MAPGDRVNLERAVTADKRLGGHIVQGHVDGVGTVVGRTPSEHWEVVEIALPPGLGRYLVDKGSITVDGVSLTVVEAGDASFTVSLIPETLARTTLGFRGAGDRVNLEADVIAKHVEKLLEGHPTAPPEDTPMTQPQHGPARLRRARHRRHRGRQGRGRRGRRGRARTRATSSSRRARRRRS